MKIICIGPTAPYKGGISHYNTLLCNNLRKRHDVELISWKRRYPKIFYPAEQLDEQSKKKISSDAMFLLDCLNPITWIKAFLVIKKKGPNLIIFHWVSPFHAPIFAFICFLTKYFTKTKILLICHNVFPHERSLFDKILTKSVFYNSDFFMVHSKEDLRNLKRLKNNAKSKLGFHATYSIFDIEKYDISKLKKNMGLRNRVILFFGFVRQYKGLRYLIESMPLILRELQLDLLIVGEFWDSKEEYINMINSRGIQNYVKIIDKYVPNEDIGKYFSVSDLVVLPYLSATQSGVIQIAFGMGKPVVTTNVGGLSEVVASGKTGYVVKSKDSKEIAYSVIDFYKNNRTDFFASNISKEVKNFSWSKYVQLIESLVAGGNDLK
ncbi:glycosyltransferase [Candidatus Woesearchaeota archaeon]|nr:glycosyltransferase [Candidatus Woesearchaeota archaeon]